MKLVPGCMHYFPRIFLAVKVSNHYHLRHYTPTDYCSHEAPLVCVSISCDSDGHQTCNNHKLHHDQALHEVPQLFSTESRAESRDVYLSLGVV